MGLTGYYATKPEEKLPAINLDINKGLMSWYSLRPNIAYSEKKLFTQYSKQLFQEKCNPDTILALNSWMQGIMKGWKNNYNCFGLHELLFRMETQVPYLLLYTISRFFAVSSNQLNKVPRPNIAYKIAHDEKIVPILIKMAVSCLNIAFETAKTESASKEKIFSPQNWIKTKTCLKEINMAVTTKIMMLPTFPNVTDIKKAMFLPQDYFETRW